MDTITISAEDFEFYNRLCLENEIREVLDLTSQVLGELRYEVLLEPIDIEAYTTRLKQHAEQINAYLCELTKCYERSDCEIQGN